MKKYFYLLWLLLAMPAVCTLSSCGDDDDMEVTSNKLQSIVPNSTWIVTGYKNSNQDEYTDASLWGWTVSFTESIYQYADHTGNYYLGNNCMYLENVQNSSFHGNYIVTFKSLSDSFAEVQLYYTNKPFGAFVVLETSTDLTLRKVK